MALSAPGQSFDSQGPAWDEIFVGRLGGPDGPGIAITTALVTGEMNVRWKGLNPVMVKLSDSDMERRMEKAAKEALDQIEERRPGVRFIGQPQEIIKCAMVFVPGWMARAAFKKAGHWRLSPSGDRYAAN
ncbi:MAG: hypothetical protein LBE49_08845 [Deltaproteobacteria bacterium]|nr:hypothetical protein [Deltaproteobacteria bacterium]